MQISVILTTSPKREDNLRYCLELLRRQSHPSAQVIVVDDGSEQGEQVTSRYRSHFNLSYLWRPNDCCVARSRNLGVAQALYPCLVFLDSDMLLNPAGLEAYADYLEYAPDQALYGYFGYALAYQTSSYFEASRQVLWCDKRFEHYTPEGLIPAGNMIRYPHEWAWSGNFALNKNLYEQAGGFDEAYRGWGGEDLDFASRLIQIAQIHFFVDAWAEQQVHQRDELFHTLSEDLRPKTYQSHYDPADYQVQVIYSQAGWNSLRQAIASHYMKQIKTEQELL